jgi:hypothetical protein
LKAAHSELPLRNAEERLILRLAKTRPPSIPTRSAKLPQMVLKYYERPCE